MQKPRGKKQSGKENIRTTTQPVSQAWGPLCKWEPWLSWLLCIQVSKCLYPEPKGRAQAVGEKPRNIVVWRKHLKIRMCFSKYQCLACSHGWLYDCVWTGVLRNCCIVTSESQPFRAGSTSGGKEETKGPGESRIQGVRPPGCHTQLCQWLAGDPEKVTQLLWACVLSYGVKMIGTDPKAW